MSTNQSLRHKNRFRTAAQWIQALTTLGFLSIIYFSHQFFDDNGLKAQIPSMSPLPPVTQNEYWNESMNYGFHTENNDTIEQKSASGVDIVAIDDRKGVVFEDAKVKVLFYPWVSIAQAEQKFQNIGTRSFSQLKNGVAVIEWDLASASAKTILATLHTR